MGTGSVQFTGKVGQAAAGDVINKAPQYSNSVNVNIAPGIAPVRSGEYLTSQQKDVLGKLVLEIAALKKCEQLLVWRGVLARANAKRVKEIPIEEYRQLEDFLRLQLTELTAAAVVPPVPIVAPQSVPASADRSHQSPVETVIYPQSHPPASKVPLWLAACGLLLAVASGAAVLDTRSQLGQISDRMMQQSCQYAGQPYSLGSVVSHAGGPMRCEVAEGAVDAFARWTPADTQRSGRSAVQAR